MQHSFVLMSSGACAATMSLLPKMAWKLILLRVIRPTSSGKVTQWWLQVPTTRHAQLLCCGKYFSMAAIDSSSDLHLFRAISISKRGEKLRPSGSLSYTRIRELVLEKTWSLGYDRKKFGLHSFRAGGATVVANDPTLPERLFKHHGRWQSEKAKDMATSRSPWKTDSRVSKSLGL